MKPAKKSTMDEYLKAHPFLRETADLQLALAGLLSELVEPIPFPEREEQLRIVAEGLPLLQQAQLQQQMAAAASASLPQLLAGLLATDLPSRLRAAVAGWQAWAAAADSAAITQLFGFLLRQEDGEIHVLAESIGLQETVIRFLGWALIEALVPAEVKDPSFWEQEAEWRRAYCPVCGRRPVLAQLRKEQQGRARYLSCDGCHTVWPYQRIGCVYCGNEDLQQMHILEPEGEPSMRLDVCDRCHAYLKTYHEEGAEDVYLHDWATIHLDLLGETQGVHKEGSVLLVHDEPAHA